MAAKARAFGGILSNQDISMVQPSMIGRARLTGVKDADDVCSYASAGRFNDND